MEESLNWNKPGTPDSCFMALLGRVSSPCLFHDGATFLASLLILFISQSLYTAQCHIMGPWAIHHVSEHVGLVQGLLTLRVENPCSIPTHVHTHPSKCALARAWSLQEGFVQESRLPAHQTVPFQGSQFLPFSNPKGDSLTVALSAKWRNTNPPSAV